MRLSCVGAFASFLLLALLAPLAAFARPAPADPARAAHWSAVDLPGPLERLRQAAGILGPVDRTRLVLEVARLVYGVPEGRDRNVEVRRRALAAHLQSPPRDAPPVRVPLPLAPALWRRVILKGQPEETPLGTAILSSSTATLVYHGLFGLDDETLAYLADTRNGALDACVEHARTFATFGRRLRIHGGRILVPGGDTAVPLWERVVDASVGEPRAFIAKLLAKDTGWLAHVYDTLAGLDGPRLAFALGVRLRAGAPGPAVGSPMTAPPNHDEWFSAFAALVAASSHIDPRWTPADRPFMRPDIDLGLLLRTARVTSAGRFDRPASRGLWDAAFGVDRHEPHARGGDEVTADYLAERILSQRPETRRERLEVVAFGQRLFGDVDLAEQHLVPALETMRRFPALAITLERIGIRNPATFARAAEMARRVERTGGREQSTLAIAAFQSAMAIVDRLSLRHSLSPDRAAMLVSSLLDRQDNDGTLAVPLGDWLATGLLPALPRPTRPREGGTEASPDDVLLEALAGPPLLPGHREPLIEWEGERYRIDLGAAELARMRRVRARIAGNSLEAALALCQLAANVAARGVPAAIDARARLLAPFAARWEAVSVAGSTRVTPDDIRRAIATATSPAASRAPVRQSFLHLADAVLADTLASLAYTISLPDDEVTLLAAPGLVRAHDFNRDLVPAPLVRSQGAWSVASQTAAPDTPWHLTGSLLALDVPLAVSRLERMSSEPPPAPPSLHPDDRFTLALTVAALDGYMLDDADRDRLAAALARGHARVDEATSGGQAADALRSLAAEVRMAEWRVNGLVWASGEEPEATAEWFSLGELLALGRPELPAARLDAWGMSRYVIDGSLVLQFPAPAPWEEVGGRATNCVMATRLPDLTIRVAEWLAGLKLPAALAGGIEVRAVQDLADRAQPSDADDAPAVVRSARRMTREEFEDYVSALTTVGPLVPERSAAATRVAGDRAPEVRTR